MAIQKKQHVFVFELKDWIAARLTAARNDGEESDRSADLTLFSEATGLPTLRFISRMLPPATVAPHPLLGMRADHFFKA